MTTHILMITDKSGSMAYVANDVRGGFNTYLDGLAADGDWSITSILFSTSITRMCQAVAPADAPRLTDLNYRPDGFTALLDAVHTSVLNLEGAMTLGDDDKVLVVIQTDGRENASREATFEQVRDLIQRLEATGKWSFLFVGQGPDSWRTGEQLGTRSNLNTIPGERSTHTTYDSMGRATRMYAGGQSMSEVVDYMEEEHRKSGTLAPDSVPPSP